MQEIGYIFLLKKKKSKLNSIKVIIISTPSNLN